MKMEKIIRFFKFYKKWFKVKKEYIDYQYKKIATGMEIKSSLKKELYNFYQKHKTIPMKYMGVWKDFMIKEKGLFWYEQSKVIKMLRKTAIVLAKRKLKDEC